MCLVPCLLHVAWGGKSPAAPQRHCPPPKAEIRFHGEVVGKYLLGMGNGSLPKQTTTVGWSHSISRSPLAPKAQKTPTWQCPPGSGTAGRAQWAALGGPRLPPTPRPAQGRPAARSRWQGADAPCTSDPKGTKQAGGVKNVDPETWCRMGVKNGDGTTNMWVAKMETLKPGTQNRWGAAMKIPPPDLGLWCLGPAIVPPEQMPQEGPYFWQTFTAPSRPILGSAQSPCGKTAFLLERGKKMHFHPSLREGMSS